MVKVVVVGSRYNDICIDLAQMGSDTVEAMASAVKNAKVIIMCALKQYKESHTYRFESTHANRLKKSVIPIKMDGTYRPDGWLRLLIGVTLYYNGLKTE